MLSVYVTGQHSVLYQKTSVPRETFSNLNKSLVITEEGVKQCGYICSIKNAICNIFRFDKSDHSCTFGKVSGLFMFMPQPECCWTPVLCLGLGVDFTFTWENNKNRHLIFFKGTVLGDKEQGVGIRDMG